MSLNKLMISCGGTGGHFYPGLSVARKMLSRGGEVRMLLSGTNSMMQKEIAERYGIPVRVLPLMPSPKKGLSSSVQFMVGLCGGMRQSVREIREFAPQAVLGMGSFASLPILLAAIYCKVPRILHDGNARIGRANRCMSRFSRFLGTAFPPVNTESCACPVECVGMPLRPELTSAARMTKAEALTALEQRYSVKFDPNLPVVLIFGGSQGASIFNQVFPAALMSLNDVSVQVLHLSGPQKLGEVKNAYANARFKVLTLPGSEEMGLFYQAADLVVARSGGSTVAELTLFGKPSFLIPYPYAAEDHQFDNARFLEEHQATLLLRNSQCIPEKVASTLWALLDSPETLSRMAAAAAKLGISDAADRLLTRISQQCS